MMQETVNVNKFVRVIRLYIIYAIKTPGEDEEYYVCVVDSAGWEEILWSMKITEYDMLCLPTV